MIRVDRRDGVTWLAIDRPDRRNALSPDGHGELRTEIERAAERTEPVVVTGTGDTFCAGSDVGALADARSPDEVEALVEAEFRLHRAIESVGVPVVAAVNGPAYGGGVELVAVCDLAVAVEGATFALPETKLGVTPGYALDRVSELGGRKRALELALTGEPIGAETGREWGLLNRVVPGGELNAEVTELTDAIADAPNHAIAAVKRTVAEGSAEAVSFQRSVDRLTALLASEETQTKLSAFLDRRDG